MARGRTSSRKRGAGVGSRLRSAISGRFVKKGSEKRSPRSTIVERIGRQRKKRS